MPTKPYFMAIDQYGTVYHGLTKPRRDLLRKLGRKHAEKMYHDKTSGPPVHTGYVIGGRWLTLYEVRPVEWPA